RPWYTHQRGLSFADILRTARRAMIGIDILDPANDVTNLDKWGRSPRSGSRSNGPPNGETPVRETPFLSDRVAGAGSSRWSCRNISSIALDSATVCAVAEADGPGVVGRGGGFVAGEQRHSPPTAKQNGSTN
ncbi:MAG: hypothetical protein KKI08_17740, partial [Armatimonadetes bacterium]|nr:hypothetical protein [Armatimonadota bacterium]